MKKRRGCSEDVKGLRIEFLDLFEVREVSGINRLRCLGGQICVRVCSGFERRIKRVKEQKTLYRWYGKQGK